MTHCAPHPSRPPRELPVRPVVARHVAVLAALLALVVGPLASGGLGAQDPDSLRAGVATPPTPTPLADTLLLQPPISPRRAFLSSLLLPGYGQARLERPTASAMFFAIEAAGLLMVRKSLHDLRVAKRFESDSIPIEIGRDPETGEPIIEYGPGRYSPDLVSARRTHLEDWIAVLVFNHLFAGADAFVAAHLGERPPDLSLTRTPAGGASLRASIRW